MPARSNCLFHYTKSVDLLISILEYGFIPFYSTEPIDDLYGSEIDNVESQFNSGIGTNSFPMVCFCDIPLTSISDHTKKYGYYSIGMKQSWGLNNGLTPLWYYNNKMPLYKELRCAIHRNVLDITDIMNKDNISGNLLFSLDRTQELYRILKIYSKPMKIREINKKYFTKFHMENEWRFVPKIEDFQLTTNAPFFAYSDQVSKFNEHILDNKSNAYSIKFSLDDIEYIIVKEANQIEEIVVKIRKWAETKKYNQSSIDMLLTKVISIYHIGSDF